MAINQYVKTETKEYSELIKVPQTSEGRQIVMQRISDAYKDITGVPIPVEVLETSPYMNYIGTVFGMYETIWYVQTTFRKTSFVFSGDSGSPTTDPRYSSSGSGGEHSRKWAKWSLLKVDSKTKKVETLMRHSYLPEYETSTCPSGIQLTDDPNDIPEGAVAGNPISIGTVIHIEYLGLLTDVKYEETSFIPDDNHPNPVYPYASVEKFHAGAGECAPNQNQADWNNIAPTSFLFPVQDNFSINVKVESLINADNVQMYIDGYYLKDYFIKFSLDKMYEDDKPIFNMKGLNWMGDYFDCLSATRINTNEYLIGMNADRYAGKLLKINGDTAQIEGNRLYNYRLRRMKNISKAKK